MVRLRHLVSKFTSMGYARAALTGNSIIQGHVPLRYWVRGIIRVHWYSPSGSSGGNLTMGCSELRT